MVLVIGAAGGWMFLRSSTDGEEPIVVGTTSNPTMVDPGGAWEASGAGLMSNIFQSLLTFAPGQEQPVPDAAESCSFTDSELTVFRCELREDLTFSNGNPLTSAGVKFSYDRILAMEQRAEEEDDFEYSGPAGMLESLSEVRIEGQSVIFELHHPNATFPFVVASSAGAIVDQDAYELLEPRTDGEAVGSGPYRLEAFEAEEYAELEPNPEYRGAAKVSEYPISIRYFVQQDDGATAEEQLAEAWDAGELDVNDGKMPPDVMAQMSASDPDYRVFESTSGAIRTLAFNTNAEGPVSERATRHVAAALLDREAITRHVQHGTVEPLYSLIPVGFPGHGTPYYDQYQDVDTDDLRQELEEAGLEIPVPLDIAYSRGAANHEEAELIQRQLEADGLFDVEIEYHPWGDFLPGIYDEESYEAFLIGWRPDFPDPATFTDDIIGTGNGLGTGYRDPEIDQLIDGTQGESDRGRAAVDFQEIHEVAAEAAPVVPIWQEKRILISEPGISGLQYLTDNSAVWRLWELARL